MRINNGKEYVNEEVKEYLQDNGIQLELTAAYSPSQNGVAERVNWTLVEHAHAMLEEHHLLKFLWPEAVAYAMYLKNQSPTRAIKDDLTPEEVFWGTKPDISTLQEFGVKCWVLQQDNKRSKLDLKSREFIFTGLTDESRAWRYDNSHFRQSQTSRNVIFPDSNTTEPTYNDYIVSHPSLLKGESGSKVEQTPDGNNDISDDPMDAEIAKIKRDKPLDALATQMKLPIWHRKVIEPYKKSAQIASVTPPSYQTLHNPASQATKMLEQQHATVEEPSEAANIAIDYACVEETADNLSDEPLSLEEAKTRLDWHHWKKAMDEEYNLLTSLGTWQLEELPQDKSLVDCKWTYRLKRDGDKKITRYKARLVAKGFSQIPGIDFFKTYAPVVRLDTFCLLMAIATQRNLIIHGMDVVGAYLNDKLDESIYMTQPPEYSDGSGKVAHLKLTLYELKQSGQV